MDFEERSVEIESEEKRAFLGLVEALKSRNLHLQVNFGASVDVGRIFYGMLQSLGCHQPSIWEDR